jgi:hypothetical protein
VKVGKRERRKKLKEERERRS